MVSPIIFRASGLNARAPMLFFIGLASLGMKPPIEDLPALMQMHQHERYACVRVLDSKYVSHSAENSCRKSIAG